MSNKIKSVNETATKESLLIGLKENVKSLLRKKDETFYDLGESLNIIKALTAHNEFSKFIRMFYYLYSSKIFLTCSSASSLRSLSVAYAFLSRS